MTTPITHGYPDWGRFSAQADVVYNVENGTVAANPVTRGAYFVGNVPAVGFFFSVTAGAATVLVEWYDSAALTNLLATETYEFPNGTFTQTTLATLGPYLFLSILDGGAGVTFNCRLWAAPVGRSWASGAGGSVLISVTNTAIAAGVTATNNASEIYVGPAYWTGWQGLANFVVFLEALDITGAVTTLDRWQSAGLDFWRPVYLPPGRVRIRHVNQSGANTVYSSVLLKDPHGLRGA